MPENPVAGALQRAEELIAHLRAGEVDSFLALEPGFVSACTEAGESAEDLDALIDSVIELERQVALRMAVLGATIDRLAASRHASTAYLRVAPPDALRRESV